MEVEGLLNLDDFRDVTGLELPDGPYETVAGYIVARLGHVPEIGESAAFDGHLLTVVGVDGRRVSRVRVSIRPEVTLQQVESADVDSDADPGPAAQSG